MDHQDEQETAEHQQRDAEEAPQHEVNPADNPGPRGNDDRDPERVEKAEEDLDRTLPG